jgi:broad specificity phosphatase PhoE
MRLYIIRHADPDYQNNTITPEGHLEAKALAKRLQQEGITKVYSSPFGRAIDTAKYTSELLGLDYEIEDWTKEMWQSLKLENSPWGLIASYDLPGEVLRDGPCMPNHNNWHENSILQERVDIIKEAVEEVKLKSDEFLSRHGYERVGGKYLSVDKNEEKIAVFCHGGISLCWLAHLLEIPLTLMWSGFWIPPSSVTTILFDQRSEKYAVPRCIGLGDVSHLYEAGLPIKPRGILANFY